MLRAFVQASILPLNIGQFVDILVSCTRSQARMPCFTKLPLGASQLRSFARNACDQNMSELRKRDGAPARPLLPECIRKKVCWTAPCATCMRKLLFCSCVELRPVSKLRQGNSERQVQNCSRFSFVCAPARIHIIPGLLHSGTLISLPWRMTNYGLWEAIPQLSRKQFTFCGSVVYSLGLQIAHLTKSEDIQEKKQTCQSRQLPTKHFCKTYS